MMKIRNEISREEAEGRLVCAVENFDWVKAFLGNEKKDELLTNYRALHAQLRKGDKLSIDAGSVTYHAQYGVEIEYPIFKIVLYPKEPGKLKIVSSFGRDSSVTTQLLYQD